MIIDILTVIIFIFLSLAFVFGSLFVSGIIRPHKPNQLKNSVYECGEPPIGSGWLNYNMRFTLIALIFVIFDIEIAFIYPVAIVFKTWISQNLGAVALFEILFFIGILLIGLIYVWIKKDLEWAKDFQREGKEAIMSFAKKLPPKGRDV